RRRHTRFSRDWSSDVCSSDLFYLVEWCSIYSILSIRLYVNRVEAQREITMPRKPQPPASADGSSAAGGVAAVDRALNLLKVFKAGDPPLRLADLAERSGLYKSTALRLLASLEHAGLVQRLDDGHYVLGHEIARIYRVYSGTFSEERLVIPILQELVNITGESASYHVVQGQDRLCRYRVDS